MKQKPENVRSPAEDKEIIEAQFKQDLSGLSKERQDQVLAQSAEVDSELLKMNQELDLQYDVDNRYRKAGFLPSQAEEVLHIGKKQPVGRIFKALGSVHIVNNTTYSAHDRFFVRTPYNTVVEAQVYIDTLQDQIIALGDLNSKLTSEPHYEITSKLTSESFFGLIKLAFKKLIQ